MAERDVFLIKPKHQYHLSHCGQCVYVAQSWKEKRLLSESMFIPNGRWTSILKMIESEVFLMEPKHKYHLSNIKNCVYVAQSWKESRLLCESMLS